MDDLNLPFQIPVGETTSGTDDFDINDADSALSIASSRWNLRWEHGRAYLDYHNNGFLFPSDEGADHNERLLDAMVFCILDKGLFFAPVDPNKLRNVLDVATGIGLWAEQVADRYPDCHVIGLDQEARENGLYPNLTFQLDSIQNDWVFNQDVKFDHIHLRNIFATLKDDEWPKLYQQCYDFMEPGGYIEQIEVELVAHCDDGTKKENSTIFKLADLADDLSRESKLTFRIAEKMGDLIRDAGFTSVRDRRIKLPLGPWSADAKYKDIGLFFELFYTSGVQGWLMAIMTRMFGYTSKQVNDLVQDALDEIRSREHHYYFHLRVVTGRKPGGTDEADRQRSPIL